jgi:hypothetical protein
MEKVSLFSLKNPTLKPLKIEKNKNKTTKHTKKQNKVTYLDELYSKKFIDTYFS